jgi:hypothetical protein
MPAHLASLLRWAVTKFLPRLALNHDLPYLCLPSFCDHRNEPPHVAQLHILPYLRDVVCRLLTAQVFLAGAPREKWFRKVCMHCWDSLHQGLIKVWVEWPDPFVPAQNSKGWYQLQSRVLWAEVFLASMLLSCFSKSGVLTQGLMLRQALLMLELLCQPFSCDFFLFETRSHCTICPVLGLTSNIWSSCCLHRE